MDACVGEIRLFAFAWAPVGWARCDGTVLQIKQYPALYAVLGSQYGGDGQETFALPDLRGRTPVHIGIAADGTSVHQGEAGGQYEIILTSSQMPPHTHSVRTYQRTQDKAGQATGKTSADTWQIQTAGAQPRTFRVGLPTDTPSQNLTWAVETISVSGQDAAHPNMQPSLVINFCIALDVLSATAVTHPAGAAENERGSRSGAERQGGKTLGDSAPYYMGEIRLFGGEKLPDGWLPCDGRRLPVEKHDTLYSLIGNWFGGDGIREFAVPDLRGRVPVHDGKGPKGMPALRVGTQLGTETVALTSDQMPAHRHELSGTAGTPEDSPVSTGDMAPLSQQVDESNRQGVTALHGETLGQSGLSEAHDNMMPAISLQYAIAIEGEYPPEP